MPEQRSPRQVFLALVDGVAANRWADLPDLYAEHTLVTHPFDPLRSEPLRTREEIRHHFTPAVATEPVLNRTVENITIHETTDPEVIVAEFEYKGTSAATGDAYTIPCIFVLRVRDGQIVDSRDYVDHLRAAQAEGVLDELVAAIGSAVATNVPKLPGPKSE